MTTSERDKAASVRARYQGLVERIRASQDLSTEGRARQLAAAYLTTKNELATLHKQEQARVQNRAAELERRVFGPPAGVPDILSVRDAADRAAQIKKPEDARELLRRAEQNRDEVLARAVAQTALERGRQAILDKEVDAWDDTLRDFYGARPHLEQVLQEQGELERLQQPEPFSPFSIMRPSEVTEHALNTMRDAANVPADQPQDYRVQRDEHGRRLPSTPASGSLQPAGTGG